MKINLNSSPTYLPKSLEGLEQGFALYEGNDFTRDDEKQHLKLITSFVRRLNSLSDKVNFLKIDSNSENFLERAAQNINFLKTSAPQQFIDGVKLQLNLETNINRFLKTTFGLMFDFSPQKSSIKDYSYSMYKRLSEQENYSQSDANKNKYKVVLSGGLNDFFSHKMSEKLGVEKTFDFIFLHEVSHSLQHFNTKEDLQLSFVENLGNKFNRVSNLKPSYLEKVNKEAGAEGLFTTVDETIKASLYSLHKEAYADTSALLLMRNKNILAGDYNKEEMIATCVNIKNARAEVCHPQQFSGIPNASKYFSHSTTISLDTVTDKISQLEGQEMTLQEIHEFSAASANQALARAMIVLTASHKEEFVPGLNTAFCLSFDQDTGEAKIDSENKVEKYQLGLKKIESIAGLEWVAQLEKKLKEFDSLNSQPKPENHWSHKAKPEQRKEKLASAVHMIGFEIIKPNQERNIKEIKMAPIVVQSINEEIPNIIAAPNTNINFKDKIKNFRKESEIVKSPSLSLK